MDYNIHQRYSIKFNKTNSFLEYNDSRTDFLKKCQNLSEVHLETYIEIITFKNCKTDLLLLPEQIFDLLRKSHEAKNMTSMSLLLDIMEFTLILMGDECWTFLKVLQKWLCIQEKEIDRKIYLQILLLIFNVNENWLTVDDQLEICKRLFDSKKTVRMEAFNVARFMINKNPSVELLHITLAVILKKKSSSDLSLEILTFFIDFYLKNEKIQQIITENEELWFYLQNVLIENDLKRRKNAYFILRKIFDQNRFSVSDVVSLAQRNFCVIFETLEEQSSHIVLPSLKLLPTIDKGLNKSWTFILLILLLKHKNKLVLEQSVVYTIENVYFRKKSSEILDNSISTELFCTLLKAMNNAFIYTNNQLNVEKIAKFISSSWDILIEQLESIEWKSSPWYVIIEAMHLCSESLNGEVVCKCLNITNRLQNVLIRKSIKIKLMKSNKHSKTVSVRQVFDVINSSEFSETDIIDLLDEFIIEKDDIKRLFQLMVTKKSSKFVGLSQKVNVVGFKSIKNELIEMLNNFSKNKKDFFDSTLSLFELFCRHTISSKEDKINVFINIKHLNEKDDLTKSFIIMAASISPDFQEFLITEKIEMSRLLSTMDFTNLIDRFGMSAIQVLLVSVQGNILKFSSVVDLIFSYLISLPSHERFFIFTMKLLSLIRTCNYTSNVTNYYDKIIEVSQKIKGLTGKLMICIPRYSKYILMALTYGDPLKGDERIEYDICREIYKDEFHDETFKPCNTRCDIIFELPNLSLDLTKIRFLKNELFNMSLNLNSSKPRYFADSIHHRLKLRIVQALAQLFNLDKHWDDRLLDFLLKENNQPNVTLIIECIIATVINENQVKLLLEKSNSNHSRQSIFLIMFYICKIKNSKELAEFCINSILPWTMGQHFNTRIIAQTTIVKLINDFSLLQDYETIYQSIMLSFEHKNAKALSHQCLKDFRFERINATDLLNPGYYLYEIPRLTKMAPDEFVSLEYISCKQSVTLLNECELIRPITHYVTDFDVLTVEKGEVNIQKKMTPTKELIPNKELIEALPNHMFISKKDNKGLIVVASLVSKSPNLGGLCRTCEIFGVEKLVMDSLQDVEKKEFQALSMTSEKWLNMIEIKPWKLFDYIRDMKSQGYCIVGAEQTSNGKQMNEMKFPKKVILILGHEKNGIPPDVLSLLDMAVEIPQFGVTRSLNVHVTGAIFMWEYVKQQMI